MNKEESTIDAATNINIWCGVKDQIHFLAYQVDIIASCFSNFKRFKNFHLLFLCGLKQGFYIFLNIMNFVITTGKMLMHI